jgi:glycosyltransferase involved in cell wall biosynthesis
MDLLIVMSQNKVKTFILSSDDYAIKSRLSQIFENKLSIIHPPCNNRDNGKPEFRETSGVHIGFLGRIVEEKGLEFLIDAFYEIHDSDARLLIAGDFLLVAGGSIIDKLRIKIHRDPRIKVLGFIPENKLSNFYASLDIFALPSINSFEAFGIAQAEALMQGIPVISSNLPGVRIPVSQTGHGVLVRPKSSPDITNAINTITLEYQKSASVMNFAKKLYSVQSAVEKYKFIFKL